MSWILVAMVWATAATCIPIMRKLQPDCWKAYAVYVAFICTALTLFVVWHLSQR